MISEYAYTGDTDSLARVIFTHPAIKPDLVLRVNPNEISWSYGLNTANFPTYGGEVVQILSMFFDDMTITGDLRSSKDAETIYSWFLRYLQTATQGSSGRGSYDTRPVTFSYPSRGWTFKIYPKEMPNFHYGLEVVAPSYTIVASVAEPDADFKATLESTVQFNAQYSDDFDTFGKATAAIGYIDDNPFSGPTSKVYSAPDYFQQTNKQLSDWFNNLIPAYQSGDFSSLTPSSKPLTTKGLSDGTKQFNSGK